MHRDSGSRSRDTPDIISGTLRWRPSMHHASLPHGWTDESPLPPVACRPAALFYDSVDLDTIRFQHNALQWDEDHTVGAMQHSMTVGIPVMGGVTRDWPKHPGQERINGEPLPPPSERSILGDFFDDRWWRAVGIISMIFIFVVIVRSLSISECIHELRRREKMTWWSHLRKSLTSQQRNA